MSFFGAMRREGIVYGSCAIIIRIPPRSAEGANNHSFMRHHENGGFFGTARIIHSVTKIFVSRCRTPLTRDDLIDIVPEMRGCK